MLGIVDNKLVKRYNSHAKFSDLEKEGIGIYLALSEDLGIIMGHSDGAGYDFGAGLSYNNESHEISRTFAKERDNGSKLQFYLEDYSPTGETVSKREIGETIEISWMKSLASETRKELIDEIRKHEGFKLAFLAGMRHLSNGDILEDRIHGKAYTL